MGSTRICTGLTMVGLLTGAQVLAESGRGPRQDPSSQPAAENAGRYWPQWRGPMATGVATRADPPVEWSETRNIRWKISLPGTGHSTPIVWGERVFLTAAVPYGDPLEPRHDNAPGVHDSVPVTRQHRFVALAVSRRDGKIIWQRTLTTELAHEGGHYTGSFASNSPATDGEHLFAFFGSRGLYALDLDGKLKWKTGSRQNADQTCARRGQFTGAVRRHADRQLGSRRRIVRDGV